MVARGGRIRDESDGLGQGTQITFTLLVAEESGVAGILPDRRLEKRNDTRILVVDDDPKTVGYVRDTLVSEGFVPLVTGDPRKVPNLIKTTKPRRVLLDLMLPGIDGIELTERLPETSASPVIFISGYGRDETMTKALDIAAADYIVKPMSPTNLASRVRSALRKRYTPPNLSGWGICLSTTSNAG